MNNNRVTSNNSGAASAAAILPLEEHIRRTLAILQDNLARSNRIQQDFLEQQAQALRTIADAAGLANPFAKLKSIRLPFINKEQLWEFGRGSIAKCFGPAFAILDRRKSPRIPNGDLLMIDRVLSISGERGVLKPPADIYTELDIPNDAWFLTENKYPGLPLALLLEIALQPCGILSAYLGTSLVLPEDINIFRNLDGNIRFFGNPVLAGRTVSNHARLLSSLSSGGMLIQKYAFELSTEAGVFLSGESSFGYFRQEAMENQVGLDSGKEMTELAARTHGAAVFQELDPAVLLPRKTSAPVDHLDLVDRLKFTKDGGRFGHGLIAGEKELTGREWFYENHFFQDPVMPGSLGVEAIVQGLWAYLKYSHLDQGFASPMVDFASVDPLIWKYRGQVTPASRRTRFEIHLAETRRTDTTVQVGGEADFWVEDKRIYSIRNLGLTLKEGLK